MSSSLPFLTGATSKPIDTKFRPRGGSVPQRPAPELKKVLAHLDEHGIVSVPEVRELLGINKAGADALLAKLQMQARLITGDITRVYRGPDLKYSGWQRSCFCTPEALFEDMDFPFPGYKPRTLNSSLTPTESLEFLKETIRESCGDVSYDTKKYFPIPQTVLDATATMNDPAE